MAERELSLDTEGPVSAVADSAVARSLHLG